MTGRWEMENLIDTQIGGGQYPTMRLQMAQGNEVVAANDLTLGPNGNTFSVSGSTTIWTIDTTSWILGSEICLLFRHTPTVTHGAGGAFAPIALRENRDWTVTSGSVLLLRYVERSGDLRWREVGRLDAAPRHWEAQGADIASATNLSLGTDGNYFGVTGTTTIELIDLSGWDSSSVVVLEFQSALTIKHLIAASGNYAPISLVPGMDWACPAGATLTLRRGVNFGTELWREIARSEPPQLQTVTDQATLDWDLDLGDGVVTLGASRTMGLPTNLQVGTYHLRVIQGGAGSFGITWNAVFKWAGGTAPTLSTVAGKYDVLAFYCDGTNFYGTASIDVR